MSPTCRTRSHIPNTRTCPCGHVLVFPLPLPCFEHQKVPTWVLAHLSSPLPISNTSPLPLPRLEHQNEPVCGSFSCSHTSTLPFSRLEHQNEPTRAHSDVRAPLPVSTTRMSPHRLVLVLTHLPSFSPSSRTSPLPLPRLFTFLVYFYIRIVSFFVFNFI